MTLAQQAFRFLWIMLSVLNLSLFVFLCILFLESTAKKYQQKDVKKKMEEIGQLSMLMCISSLKIKLNSLNLMLKMQNS